MCAGAHRQTGAGDGRETPLLSRLNPGTERVLGRPSRCFGTASGPNCAPPNLSGQYTSWEKVVKKKTPHEHKIFDSACPKYLSVVVRFQNDPHSLSIRWSTEPGCDSAPRRQTSKGFSRAWRGIRA